MGGPKEKEHILRGGINDANNFNGMRQYKEALYKVVLHKEYVWVGWSKWVLKVFDPSIGYCDNFLVIRP